MDTVTEARSAIAVAREGGVPRDKGVIVVQRPPGQQIQPSTR